MSIQKQIDKRRTFAIISHPDAGKTTLTEKFLLYGGAKHLAGSVTARRKEQTTSSDWMELEKERGISVSSTVLQFDYRGFSINLLDTPGHADFSEDTYRVLTAVDAVIMVIDAAKGVEERTRKLFEVCRMRGLPIFTFVNKCDRPGRDPFDLVDEVEKTLGITACPLNWPIGMGSSFAGVYDRIEKAAHFFNKTDKYSALVTIKVEDFKDPDLQIHIGNNSSEQLEEEIELLNEASPSIDSELVLEGKQTPVFFGSALNDFGVKLLLDGFLSMSPPPYSRRLVNGEILEPTHEAFSGFIFKIQANMDLKHRDRIAFCRICSGKFSRDMVVTHKQSEKKVRLGFSHKLFGRDRETQNHAYPGDILGLAGHSEFGIGDTLTEDRNIEFEPIPRFPPECFTYVINNDTQKFKSFRKGMDQLLQEKVVQRFTIVDSGSLHPLLGAVGQLQFDVVKHRLEHEYGVPTRLEAAPFSAMRWLAEDVDMSIVESIYLGPNIRLAQDEDNRYVLLFTDEWNMNYFSKQNPKISLTAYPGGQLAATNAQ